MTTTKPRAPRKTAAAPAPAPATDEAQAPQAAPEVAPEPPKAKSGAVRANVTRLAMAQALPIVAKGEAVEFEPGSIEQFVDKHNPDTVLRIVHVGGELAAQPIPQE